MILAIITINENEGVTIMAQSNEATPYEVDIARKFSELVKNIQPPLHGSKIITVNHDNLPTFQQS